MPEATGVRHIQAVDTFNELLVAERGAQPGHCIATADIDSWNYPDTEAFEIGARRSTDANDFVAAGGELFAEL